MKLPITLFLLSLNQIFSFKIPYKINNNIIQIQNKTNNGQPLYETQTQERRSQTQNLISQFIQLTEERNKLDEMVGEYQTLDKEQTQGDIMINQNYYSFLLLLALAIIIIIALYLFNGSNTTPSSNSDNILQTGGKLGSNAYYLVFGIILLMFITNYSVKNSMN
jgi:ABC-type dipeptide/oligopeptide/nickel transport system permease component